MADIMIKCKDCKHWDGITNRSDQEPRDALYGYCKMLFLSFEPYAYVQVLHSNNEKTNLQDIPKLYTYFDFGCIGGKQVKR